MFYAYSSESKTLARVATAAAFNRWLADHPSYVEVPADFIAIPSARWEDRDGVEIGTPVKVRTPLSPEQQRMAERWLPLAYKLCLRFLKAQGVRSRSFAADELKSATQEYLIRAVQGYRAETGFAEGTYVGKCVVRGLRETYEALPAEGITYLSRQAARPVRLDIQDYVNYESIGHKSCSTVEPMEWSPRTRTAILRVIEEEVNERCAHVWELHQFEGLTAGAIGKRLGCSKWWICLVLAEIEGNEKLRRRVEKTLESVI